MQFPLIISFFLLLLTSCSRKEFTLDLMPSPEVYSETGVTPFDENSDIYHPESLRIPYITDRLPNDDLSSNKPYSEERGYALRTGSASVGLSGEPISWEDAREISILKNRTDKYPLKVENTIENGVLLVPPVQQGSDTLVRSYNDFINLVQKGLDRSSLKEITLYVHGYNTNFEGAVLVATELWHYMGYEGVMIPYIWPATMNTLAYFKDMESARDGARKLRNIVNILSQETSVKRINIIGYSMGTRVVTWAIHQLALEQNNRDKKISKLGSVIIIGSDVDRANFIGFIDDGILNIVDDFTVYTSKNDKALKMSKKALRRDRLGQPMSKQVIKYPELKDYIASLSNLHFIDVLNAPNSGKGSGHDYFRKSPWVSSDILMNIRYNLSPEQRGLVYKKEWASWEFPEDYTSRLSKLLNDNWKKKSSKK